MDDIRDTEMMATQATTTFRATVPAIGARLLRRPEVEALTGLARSTIYAMMRKGKFPNPKRIGDRAVAWAEADIVNWLDCLPNANGRTE